MVLSIRASTASCKILFSFRKITSGAAISFNFFNRLFRFITLLYKSLTSEVAYLPPSKGTIGRRAGGITGILTKNIHSGLTLELIIEPITLILLFILATSKLLAFSLSFFN